jgi:hypothetical protein
MFAKKLCIFSYSSHELLSFFIVDREWFSGVSEIVIFFSDVGVLIFSLATIGGTFDIITLNDFLFCVENVCHDYEITFTDHLTLDVFLDEFVKTEKFGYEGVWVLFYVIIVILENTSEFFVLTVMDSF